MNKKIAEIETLAKKLENEKDFGTMVKDFSYASTLIKSAMDDLKVAVGTVTEIVDGVDRLFSPDEEC